MAGRPSLKDRRKNFIKKSIEKFGSIYDYSKVLYENNSTSVEIICPTHGSFHTRPACHTSKSKYGGCPECYAEKQSDLVEYVASEIKKRGGVLLDSMNSGKNYIKSESRIKVQCNACSKIWTPQWNSIKARNRWCGVCTSKYAKSMSFDDVETLAAELDLEVLEFPNNPLPFVNAPEKLKLKCKVCDHTQTKTLNAIKICKKDDRIGCKNCSSFAKGSRTFENIQETLKEHEFEVLQFPDNGKIKKAKDKDIIKIKCSMGHVQETNVYNIYTNGLTRYDRIPCKECGNELTRQARRMPYEEFLQKAEEKYPGTFEYPEENKQSWIGAHGTTKIVCEKHGEIDVLATTFLNSNENGCPKCARAISAQKQSLTNKEYSERLKKAKNNIICLGKYVNMCTKILHQCLVCNHEWRTVPPSALKSSACPECSKSFHREGWTREVLVELFGTEFPSIRPDWMRNPKTGRNLEVDCFSEKLGLGLEYQGAQHYESIEFFGGDNKLIEVQKRDRIKTNTFMKKGYVLWRVDNRPLRTLAEAEFKKTIREKIEKLALSEHFTPSWMPNAKKIKSFFLTD